MSTSVSSSFFFSFAIMFYFNIKYYVTYASLKQSSGFFKSDRKIKLVIASLLNVLHILLYFLTKDNIIGVDGCSLARTAFVIVIT